jgi:hypothetical protein
VIEVPGADLWTYPAHARVVTTNSRVRKDGRAVMGAGVAQSAAKRYVGLNRLLGAAINERGNHVHVFFCPTGPIVGVYEWVITFPTKEHWRNDSPIDLIERSAREMVELVSNHQYAWWRKIVMPKPGCGLGGKDWEDVRPLLAQILDDRFHVCV